MVIRIFVRRYNKERNYQSRVQLVKKKQVNITDPYMGDKPFEFLEHHLSKATGKICPAAHLQFVLKNEPLIVQQPTDALPLPHISQSSVLYWFTCSCSTR